MISIYVRKKSEDHIVLSDGGETIEELEMSGLDIRRSKKRRLHLQGILNSYGVEWMNSRDFIISATTKSFPQVKHRLLQAIMSIDDMFVLSAEKVENFFTEDVEMYLNINNVMYTKDVMFMGKSKLAHNFDFSIPVRQNNKQKNFLTKAINNPRKDILKTALFMIDDVRTIRTAVEGLFVINDEKRMSNDFRKDIVEATKQYEISVIEWSNRDILFPELNIVAN
jgi:hypothetical protein